MAIVLSIIVPVFNVQHYLDECLTSLLNQDIDRNELEIILVDDGSTDDGGKKCDSFSRDNKNVFVIHQANQGLSAARNTGLRIARGSFVMFVDSDDWLESNSLLELIRIMRNDQLDILRFNYSRIIKENGGISKKSANIKTSSVMCGLDFLVKELGFTCYAWQFIVRKEFLIDNALFFKPGILYEDTEWTPRILVLAQRVASTDTPVYCYRIREGSITTGSVEKRVNAQLRLIDDLSEQMKKQKNPRWFKGMISHTVVTILSAVGVHLYGERGKYLKELKEKDVYPLSHYMSGKKKNWKIFLINLSPRFACTLIHFINL